MKTKSEALAQGTRMGRPLLMAAFGSIIITASSTYVALRMSALPWPTVFVTILSFAFLKALTGRKGQVNLQEVNIAQTGMSAGAMVAGGLAFTVPALFRMGIYTPYDPNQGSIWGWMKDKYFIILTLALIGAILGSVLCFLNRKKYTEGPDALTFPIGIAAARTIQVADQSQAQGGVLFTSLGLSALFTLLRDWKMAWPNMSFAIPSTLQTGIPLKAKPAEVGGSYQLPLGVYLSPLAMGTGFLIGLPSCLYWFGGAVISDWGIATLLPMLNIIPETDIANVTSSIAIPLLLGGGLAIVVQELISMIKKAKANKNGEMKKALEAKRRQYLYVVVPCLVAFVLSLIVAIPAWAAIMMILGTGVVFVISAHMTGATGVNPMEILAIFLMVLVRAIVPMDAKIAIFFAAAVAVACGYAGDLLNDYKVGVILKSDPNKLLISEMVGAAVGAFVASFALLAIIAQFGGVGEGTGLTAVQSMTLSTMLEDLAMPGLFLCSLAVGFVLTFLKIPTMLVGIGMLLHLPFSVPMVLGGLWNHYQKKEHSDRNQIIASGLLGGEGLMGTLLAILAMALN